MIILKNTINTQTVYINKRKDVNLKDAVQYYTKSEADSRFQPKGDYVTPEDVDSIVGSVVDEKIAPFQNEIDELETSKQEVFQVNQPLYFERDGEDLTLNVNLDNYATKEDLENIPTTIPTLKYNASTDKFEGDFQAVYSAISSKDSPFSIYLPHNNEVIEATLAFINGTDITAYASITYTGNSMHFAYYIKPDGTYRNAISQFQAQEELTPGDNIDINDELVISWVAPDVQFVNTIFTDDQSLKYATADFKGGYTVKEFPLATTESAGLMSPEDKAKLDTVGVPTMIVDFSTSTIISGNYQEMVDALLLQKPVNMFLINSSDTAEQIFYATEVSYYKPGIGIGSIVGTFHTEQISQTGTIHIHYGVSVRANGIVDITLNNIDYVTKSTYNTKITEIDTAISDLQAQIGNIGTVLDNINGEVI